MKQKIVIKVQMTSERSKSKALKIAAEAHGVESVALEGSEKTRVVLIGEKVDAVRLTSSLRNKVGDAEIISIAEVKPTPTNREKEKEKEIREREKEKERREREREREKVKKEAAAKKLKRELEVAKNVKPSQTREKEREKERERKKKEEARKQAEAKETKILINLLRAKLAM